MVPDQETELTLSNGRLLGLFLGLIVLCGVFFVMGYMLGKNRAPGNSLLADSPSTATDGQMKPEAIQGVQVPAQAAVHPAAPVQTSAPEAQPQETETSADSEAAPAAESAPAPEPKRPVQKSKPQQQPQARSAAPVSSGSYTVQVAAVSNQQDAERLASALRRKQYAVFVTSHAPDNLFHVQVGPFNDAKQAEAARSRLASDGYNAFMRR
jgi:cell division septation protein DedD